MARKHSDEFRREAIRIALTSGLSRRHLSGLRLPSLSLRSTEGSAIDLSTRAGTVVIYCYPRTGRPDEVLPDGWDDIPGARGCTPQACAFRDHYQELKTLGAEVFGLSTQSIEYQKEMATRLHVPFLILSDDALILRRLWTCRFSRLSP